MINEKVRRLLIEYNPFWKEPFEVEYMDRAVYPEIKKLIPEPQIISLCGLRRVGKTTLLKKIMSDLIGKHGPDTVLYFSFDDFQELELQDVMDAFREIHGKEPKYLFFDEIQKLQNWAEKAKILYDTKKFKIFVSGSESLFLKKGSRESLAGRIFEFEIKGLAFSEYLGFTGKGKLAEKPMLYERELKAELESYLLTGGFPELIGKADRSLIRQYIRNAVIEKIVFLDMVRIYPIENPQKLIQILEILIDNPGMLVDIQSFSQELGISRQTLSKYLEYLELAHLTVKLFNYSKNRSTSEKRLKKFYPTFLSPALSDKGDEQHKGKVIETFCVLHSGTKFFWRDKYKNEVDIVLNRDKETVPVEIKYRARHLENRGLEKFCRKYSSEEAVIVTKDVRKETKEFARIRWMPAFEFLLKF